MKPHPLYGTLQAGVLVTTDRFTVIELEPLPSLAISRYLDHPHHVDYVTVTEHVDAWTCDCSEDELWHRRWISGPVPQPNILATQYLGHHRHKPGVLLGPVVLASKRTNRATGRVVTVGLDDSTLNDTIELLALYRNLIGMS